LITAGDVESLQPRTNTPMIAMPKMRMITSIDREGLRLTPRPDPLPNPPHASAVTPPPSLFRRHAVPPSLTANG
jgi:hypothetical protein